MRSARCKGRCSGMRNISTTNPQVESKSCAGTPAWPTSGCIGCRSCRAARTDCSEQLSRARSQECSDTSPFSAHSHRTRSSFGRRSRAAQPVTTLYCHRPERGFPGGEATPGYRSPVDSQCFHGLNVVSPPVLVRVVARAHVIAAKPSVEKLLYELPTQMGPGRDRVELSVKVGTQAVDVAVGHELVFHGEGPPVHT